MPLKLGTRVVGLDDKGVPTNGLGTVVDSLDMSGLALIEWDSGDTRIESHAKLVPHQMLKAAFKHGPKIRKSQ